MTQEPKTTIKKNAFAQKNNNKINKNDLNYKKINKITRKNIYLYILNT
jgi:hypothetical protein